MGISFVLGLRVELVIDLTSTGIGYSSWIDKLLGHLKIRLDQTGIFSFFIFSLQEFSQHARYWSSMDMMEDLQALLFFISFGFGNQVHGGFNMIPMHYGQDISSICWAYTYHD